MILITGGAYDGKARYAKTRFGLDDSEIVNGADFSENNLANGCIGVVKCLSDLQLLIRNILDSGGNPMQRIKEILDINPDVIFITNEIGSGIVPLEKNDRLWREEVGGICCFLAAEAEEVVRVVCGIPTVIKRKKQ